MRDTWVEIDRQRLQHNLQELKRANGPAFFCPMIKANAYGHGLNLVAPEVEAAAPDMAGVALVEEGVQLRKLGFKRPILTFAPLDRTAAEAAAEHELTPVIGRFEDFSALEAAGVNTDVHLKFNTGMQRLGFDEEQIPELEKWVKSSANLRVTGLCTHVTHGEDVRESQGPTALQFNRFLKMSEKFPGIRHAHKSSTLASMGTSKSFPEIGARPGISIYGLPHDGDRTGVGLSPVLSWKSRLTNIHRIDKGESASYSGRWVAPRRSWIGVVPCGYGDGYLRSLSNKGQMLYRGQRVPVIGSVCMDYTLLDLTDACTSGAPTAGESVVLLGEQEGAVIGAGELAALAGTIAYEIVTAISARVWREAV